MTLLGWFVVGLISSLLNPMIQWGETKKEKLIVFGCACVLAAVFGPFTNAMLWFADKLNRMQNADQRK